MEKVSDNVGDPFEGGVNDVPISTWRRTIEIESMLTSGPDDVPAPIESIGGVVYERICAGRRKPLPNLSQYFQYKTLNPITQ